MNERDALLAALSDCIARNGFPGTTPDMVTHRADLPPTTFAAHFDSLEAALAAAYDSVTDRAFSAAYAAYGATAGDWAEGVHAALGGLLGFFASDESATRLWAVESRYAGSRLIDPRNRAVDRVIELLEPGFALGTATGRPSRTIAEMVAGSLFELIRVHAVEERISQLPDALPIATMLALSPFVGRRRATEIARPDDEPSSD